MADLQARVDCLLKENGELKSQVTTKEVELKEMEALKATTKAKLMGAWERQNKALAISRKFHDFIGHAGDVINKAQLYNEGMGQPGASPRPKVIRCLVDYDSKMEKLLKEMRALLQPAEQQQLLEPP